MSRAWCGTLNNYTEAELLALKYAICRYAIIGKEKGANGTPHLQMYFYFKEKKSLRQMKDLSERAHWEQAKGTPEQNVEYCSKEKDFWETGAKPMSQKDKGLAGKRAYEDAWKLAKKGDLEAIDPGIRITNYNTLKRIAHDFAERPESIAVLEHEWRWGPTGTGKSRPIQEGTYGPFYSKSASNKWWDGYKDEEVVLIDDFDKDHFKLGYELKVWSDHYAFHAEVKGGTIFIRPKKIIVTSNWKIDEIWVDEQIKGPLHRRFKEIEFK